MLLHVLCGSHVLTARCRVPILMPDALWCSLSAEASHRGGDQVLRPQARPLGGLARCAGRGAEQGQEGAPGVRRQADREAARLRRGLSVNEGGEVGWWGGREGGGWWVAGGGVMGGWEGQVRNGTGPSSCCEKEEVDTSK